MNYLQRTSIVGICVLLTTLAASAQTLFSGGDGSQGNPYKISTEQDLRTLAEEVNKNGNSFFGKFLLQTADITFSPGTPVEPIGGPAPKGSFSRPDNLCFQGTYDGGMHKIYNLNLYDDQQLEEIEDLYLGVGFFGDLGSGATVKNVVIASGHIYGHSFVGAIAGTMHPGSTIQRCKVGPKVRIFAWSTAGGIVGTTDGNHMNIKECVNYANVNVYGMGIHKSAGGIIGSSGYAAIEGCANFGDIWSKGGFAGGIIGYYPLSDEGHVFSYPEMKGCMNAGDVSSMDPVSGGLIGCLAYNLTGTTEIHRQVSNSYSYGQSCVAHSETFGPVVAFSFSKTPVKMVNTFYNSDRYRFKVNPQSSDSQTAFLYGEAKTHAEITSDAFLSSINNGAVYLFEKDKHNINGTMPILKWINETYDPEIDSPNQYNKHKKPSFFERRAGSLFPQNRKGSFLIYNMDMNELNVQSKAMGCSNDRGWSDRVLPIKGGKSYTYFISSSAFRPKLTESGMYEKKPRTPQTANHWLITPPFYVNENTSWFHWEAGSEDESLLCSYEVYVIADENATTPEAFAKASHIFKMDAEPKLKAFIETVDGEDRYYIDFNQHKMDLSKFSGKTVRLAFRDTSTDKFFLLIGNMRMAQSNGVAATPLPHAKYKVAIDGHKIKAEGEDCLFHLYTVDGRIVAIGRHQLQNEAASGNYILNVIAPDGSIKSQKLLIP